MIIARTLGAEDFGRYGLLFATIGLIGSLAGLQLGLTVTVAVSRLRHSDPARALAAIRTCELVALISPLILMTVLMLRPGWAAEHLLGARGLGPLIVLAAFVPVVSVITGVQDCTLQGFEDFRFLGLIRIASSAISVGLVLSVGRSGGLFPVLMAVTTAIALRGLLVTLRKEYLIRREKLSTSWMLIWEARTLFVSFSLPSLLASLAQGGVGWAALFLISHQNGGLSEVAILTVGQQWRGAVFLVTSLMSTAAVPIMSNLLVTGDFAGVRQVHRLNLAANLLAGIGAGLVLTAAGPLILKSYGSGFAQGWLIFAILMLSAGPTACSNVYLQFLVSAGKLWTQLVYIGCFAAGQLILYIALMRVWGGLGYALATLVSYLIFCLVLEFRLGPELRRGPDLILTPATAG